MISFSSFFLNSFRLPVTENRMATLRKKHSKNLRRFRTQLDANLAWQPVDTTHENLGKFDDAIFFGLEEVDGNMYLQTKQALLKQPPMDTVMDECVNQGGDLESLEHADTLERLEEVGNEVGEEAAKKPLSKKKSAKKEKDQARRDKAKKEKAKARAALAQEAAVATQAVVDEDAQWAGLRIHSLVVDSLTALGFSTPTPIQASAIPKVLGTTEGGGGGRGMADVVGSAETGSGKTLAFGLPLLHTLLHNWKDCGNTHKPFALILAPTRELAMQITSVLGDVCKSFRHLRRVEVVNVIGGLSEHKQRRQLGSAGKPCHVVVATPGRLCDLLDDESVGALQDMSALRFLVVDEADRMMEDGHFPELHKIFSRVTDHEALAAKGLCPVQEARRAREGTDFDEEPAEPALLCGGASKQKQKQRQESGQDEDNEEEFDLEAQPFQFEEFPSEALLQQARAAKDCTIPLDDRAEEEEEEHKEEEEQQQEEMMALEPRRYVPRQRQTLLFSATAINVYNSNPQAKKRKGKDVQKKHQALQALGLPDHLCQLLETVGLQERTVVAHVLLDAGGAVAHVQQAVDDKPGHKRKQLDESSSAAPPPVLPRALQQFEVRVATEDKDATAYLYLLKNAGRTLIFVNSIKTARRVDGLLRALGLNCRCIHAQLQQKQRIKALESFVSSPVGILVATDVAARGLDLPKIQVVLHYDIARSPQVYIHRSGRTARAGLSGVALSIVAPEDTDHHRDVCAMLQLKTLPPLRGMDLGPVPVVRERVRLAKKIFLQSFLASQNTKQQSWLQATAEQAGLALDETLLREMSHELDSATGARQQRDEVRVQRALQADRAALRALLSEPHQEDLRVNPRQKRAFIVVAK